MSRPIWSGSINFGLVNIPVDMVMAVHERTIHFHMLTKDGACRLRQKLYCPETHKEYDFNETARGVEISPGNYVIVDQREMNRLKPEKGHAMTIVQFVDLAVIDPVFYDRVYYLNPSKDSQKAYKLLTEAMIKNEKCAVAQFVMRDREYMAVLRVLDEGLVLHTLHYADEVEPRNDAAVAALKHVKITTPEIAMAGELIKAMTKPLEIEKFRDEYRDQLQELIDAKVKGKEISLAPEGPEKPEPRTINLMEALKKSLANGASRSHAHRRSA